MRSKGRQVPRSQTYDYGKSAAAANPFLTDGEEEEEEEDGDAAGGAPLAGGGGSAPCVQLDLSIDPTKVAASQAVLDTVLDAVDAVE